MTKIENLDQIEITRKNIKVGKVQVEKATDCYQPCGEPSCGTCQGPSCGEDGASCNRK